MSDSVDLADALHRFADQSDALLRRTDTNSNRASITINAGGVGVWLCATCCAVMLACNVFLAVLVTSNNREISDLNDKLSAIYMLAPHLQPSDQGVAAK